MQRRTTARGRSLPAGQIRWSAALTAALLVALGGSTGAQAHALPTSAVLLDVGSHRVTGDVQVPLDRLAIALDREITPAAVTGSLRASIVRYVRSHIGAVGVGGRVWTVDVGGPRVERIGGVQDLVFFLTLTPPDGKVTDFDLRYDVIVEQLVTHSAIAEIRTQWSTGTFARDPVAVGVFDWTTKSLRVDPDGGSWLRGFAAAVGLGVEHISQGADHLLFLLMLLVPAPLLVSGGRWQRRDSARGSMLRVVHVVTAFAIGHSITLALATVGVVNAPSRLVEALIALSILLSAVHAFRPLAPGGEVLIAGGFGLVHGLAFASLLSDLGMTGAALASLLFGFNVGIELTQLLVVALVMPSLCLLSRTGMYGVARVSLALSGAALSAAWLLERTGMQSNPVEAVTTAAVGHVLVVPAVLAVLAALAHYATAARPSS